jgi:hypothetical protein
MADVIEPGVCAACGRPLPAQQGRGRVRRYCDATCRDRARRRRARAGGNARMNVNGNLTPSARHEYLDAIDGIPGAGDGDLVAADVAAATRRLLSELGQPGSPQGAVAAARDLSVAAEAALQAAVDRARAAGQSWRDIGDVLGTSRQAAFQRFGHPVDPRTGEPMTRVAAPDAAQRTTTFLGHLTAGRWDEVLAYCDDTVRERLDAARLASGWAHMVGLYGAYQAMGDVRPVPVGDAIVADVLVFFEAGEAMVWVRFDQDGKVDGLRLHPKSA